MPIAMDRSVRSSDTDGRLHIEVSNISKSNVCPYLGSEIPDAAALGLKPDQVYYLLRHPDELAAAVDTFNNLPILIRHVHVTSAKPHQHLIVGTTGTDAVFKAPYLSNSLAIWTDAAIACIETDQQRELSSAYHYRADMTPGVFDGVRYDGIMRDIRGNHVALVENGRAGSDVIVMDEALAKDPKPETAMKMRKVTLSPRAALAKGVLMHATKGKLAQDAKIDFGPILYGATTDNWDERLPGIVVKLRAAAAGKLAADASLDDIIGMLEKLEDPEDAEVSEDEFPPEKKDDDEEDDDDKKKKEATDRKKPAKDKRKPAKDKSVAKDEDDDEEDDDKKDKEPAKDKKPGMDTTMRAAMDAAINVAVAKAARDAEASTMARLAAIRDAEREVRPYIGDIVIAQDTALDVYKLALDSLGVDTKGVTDLTALKLVLSVQPKPGEPKPQRAAGMAMDQGALSDLHKRFPGMQSLKIR
jgi:hypothetical protein